MESHECTKEADLAVIKRDVGEIRIMMGRVDRILSGNGSTGLVTKVEVFRTAQIRVFAWLGGLILVLVGFGVWLIQSGHSHLLGQ